MKLRKEIFKIKSVYLGLSVLEISKIVMHELWYDYVKQKYGQKSQNYVIWIQTALVVYLKTEDNYVDTAKDVETRFDVSNYELHRPLPKGNKKK